MDDFIPILAILLIFGSLPTVIIFIASRRHRERMEMIKNGTNPAFLTPTQAPSSGNGGLLWGLLLLAIGAAFVVAALYIHNYDSNDMLTFGLLGLFSGIACLVYWALTAKDRDRLRRIQEEQLRRLLDEALPPKSHDTLS